jgi:hypothetical protein
MLGALAQMCHQEFRTPFNFMEFCFVSLYVVFRDLNSVAELARRANKEGPCTVLENFSYGQYMCVHTHTQSQAWEVTVHGNPSYVGPLEFHFLTEIKCFSLGRICEDK